jgi:endo-1,4-beta-xylanase
VTAEPLDCATSAASTKVPLWQTALRRGLVYGSSTATWQISDPEYARLYAREAAILFTEDDLLWYRLRPTPRSGIQFTFGDEIVGFAERHGILVFGAHLVWDEGFGDGWKHSDLFGLSEKKARHLLFGTVEAVVERYRGRMAGWIVVNEALDGSGVRTDFPWYQTIGPSYIEESFHLAHESDPEATLVLNDFGYETDTGQALSIEKRAVTLKALDELLDAKVPVHALGIQAHLNAWNFAQEFDPKGYRRFLSDVADRGLKIVLTEMDVLDDGLPKRACLRDDGVADVMRRYLDVALDEPAVVSLMTFGLSDRYTWLEEDFPRDDGAPRRPLAFDDELRPTPAYDALKDGLEHAATREVFWKPPRSE